MRTWESNPAAQWLKEALHGSAAEAAESPTRARHLVAKCLRAQASFAPRSKSSVQRWRYLRLLTGLARTHSGSWPAGRAVGPDDHSGNRKSDRP